MTEIKTSQAGIQNPTSREQSGVRPPVFNTITANAELKNRLAVWSTLFANPKSSASVSPENKVPMEARSYRLI